MLQHQKKNNYLNSNTTMHDRGRGTKIGKRLLRHFHRSNFHIQSINKCNTKHGSGRSQHVAQIQTT